jgi:hypothetical protein
VRFARTSKRDQGRVLLRGGELSINLTVKKGKAIDILFSGRPVGLGE